MSKDFCDRPLIVTDFETTGYHPQFHDIIEIGALRVCQSTLDYYHGDVFERKIKIQHWDTVQLAALKVNGYTDECWADAVDLKEALRDFRHFANDGIFCAWNITFEYRFLCEAFERAEMENIFLERRYSHHIDIPSIVWSQYPESKSMSYDKIAMKLGIHPEEKPHKAINGALQDLRMLRVLRGEV